MDTIRYSQIPAAELPTWNDDDLSGAIWDEAIELAGGYGYTVESVARIPLGFRAVLAEGAVRAHVEGDGLACSIWNDNGTAMFLLAAACLEKLGVATVPVLLREIDTKHAAWESSTGKQARDFTYEEFCQLAHATELKTLEDQFNEVAMDGFATMMSALRERPGVFEA